MRSVLVVAHTGRRQIMKSPCFLGARTESRPYFWVNRFASEMPMTNAHELVERARMFEERAERATDPISRQHYREMAAHYRALSMEHRETERELAH